MIVLNFHRQLTADQLGQIEQLKGIAIARVDSLPTSFADDVPFAFQARELIDRVSLSTDEWESASLLINLPPLSSIAGLVLAEIHARHGRFPQVIRMRPKNGGFEVSEILDLNQVRIEARSTHDSQRRATVTSTGQSAPPSAVIRTGPAPSGSRLGDRYRLLEVVGRGSFGIVSKATDEKMKRDVAIKQLNQTAQISASARERFRREQVQAQLQHPYICQVLDCGTDTLTGDYLVFEFVRGVTLRKKLELIKTYSPNEAVELTIKLAEAMHVAHENGVVHRDLKPENVILNERGDPKITDFGLCLVLDDSRSRVTHDGAALGTWHYMAPEVLSGQTLDHTHLIDVYSLGVMLFEFIAGKPPYVGAQDALRYRIENYPLPKLRETDTNIDSRIDDICASALAKSPTERLPSMAEFARRLRDVQNSPPVTAALPSVQGTIDESGDR